MLRIIETHKAKTDERLRVYALGEPGAGGANSLYGIAGLSPYINSPHLAAIDALADARDESLYVLIQFQTGNPAEHCNGFTIEALLAICADKLEGHQRSQFACAENATALTNINAALNTLKARTARRVTQGIEGTQTPDA